MIIIEMFSRPGRLIYVLNNILGLELSDIAEHTGSSTSLLSAIKHGQRTMSDSLKESLDSLLEKSIDEIDDTTRSDVNREAYDNLMDFLEKIQ